MCVQVLVRSCDHTWQIQVLRISGIYSGYQRQQTVEVTVYAKIVLRR